MKTYDIAVIGGGASGLAAAIEAAQSGRSVVLLEAQARVGRRLLATGNGRCNITNALITPSDYRTDRRENVAAVLSAVSDEAYEEFFRRIGIPFYTDGAGRVYPCAQSAAAVLDMLRIRLHVLGADELCGVRITSITPSKGGFALGGAPDIRAKRVIIACGGTAAQFGGTADGMRLLEEMGHTCEPPAPSLVPLRVNEPNLGALKGTRIQCRVWLEKNGRVIDTQTGELQFNEGALSGIAVFNLSARISGNPAGYVLCACLLPDMSESEIVGMLRERRGIAGLSCEELLLGLLAKRPAQCVMKCAGIKPLTRPAQGLTDAELTAAARVLMRWEFPVTGLDGMQKAQVMHGGIKLGEFGADMQSKKRAGVYACGEVLNCDGPCGGYNLRWAFSSGIVAGRSAAQSLGKGGLSQRESHGHNDE